MPRKQIARVAVAKRGLSEGVQIGVSNTFENSDNSSTRQVQIVRQRINVSTALAAVIAGHAFANGRAG